MKLHKDHRTELKPARAAVAVVLLFIAAGVVDVPESKPLTWVRMASAGLIGLMALGVVNHWGQRFANWADDFWWRINRRPPDMSGFVPLDKREWKGPSGVQRKGL